MTKTPPEGSIRRFFDAMANGRDAMIASDPVYRFEQAARQEAVLLLLQAEAGAAILDIGCGNARDLSVLLRERPDLQLTGLDLSEGMLREGRSSLSDSAGKVRFVAGDASRLPLRSGSYDAVICSEVVEHVPAWHDVLREAARVLCPGGRLVLTTPNRRGLYGLDRATLGRLHEWLRPRVHPYDEWKAPREVERALARVGLTVLERRGVCYLPGYSLTYRLPPRMKGLLVRAAFVGERLLSISLPRLGYMFAVIAVKE